MLWLEDPPPISIGLQPYGKVQPSVCRQLKARLEREFFAKVTILPAHGLPKSAFYAPRSRYRADRLLPILAGSKGFDKVIGVTLDDISTTKGKFKDWGVFGLGSIGGRSCVVSSFRLGKQGAVSPLERLSRVALHEVGHTLGLEHCPTLHCTMSDAEGALKTVDDETGFCQLCRRRVKAIRN